eukprot:10216684-Alexandrium_andersonii.AAC.1
MNCRLTPCLFLPGIRRSRSSLLRTPARFNLCPQEGLQPPARSRRRRHRRGGWPPRGGSAGSR